MVMNGSLRSAGRSGFAFPFREVTPVATVVKEPTQRVEDAGREATHTHETMQHTHDHYHVAHVHVDGGDPEWRHQASWHSHEHDHGTVLHSHDFGRGNESDHHGRRAHVHDHAQPVHPGDL